MPARILLVNHKGFPTREQLATEYRDLHQQMLEPVKDMISGYGGYTISQNDMRIVNQFMVKEEHIDDLVEWAKANTFKDYTLKIWAREKGSSSTNEIRYF